MKRKVISLAMAALMLSMPAAFTTTTQAAQIQKPQIQVTTQTPFNASAFHGKTIELNSAKKQENQAGKYIKANPSKIACGSLASIQLNDKTKTRLSTSKNSLLAAANDSSNYNLFTRSGTIDKEGGMYPIYPIDLSAGQTLQAQLQMPKNDALEYDLYLFQFGADGKLTSTPVDACMYNGNLLPDTVGTVNKGTSVVHYALIVYSRKGASATDQFTVKIALATDPDVSEPNQNITTATKFSDIITGQEYTATTLTINTPYDEDWFALNVTNPDEFSHLNIIAATSKDSDIPVNNIQVDLYTAAVVSNGITVQKITSNNGDFPVSKGYYYLRIHSDSSNFSPTSYVLKVRPSYDVAKILTDPYNNGQPCETVTWRNGTLYSLDAGAMFGIKATLLSKSGYAVKNATVTVSWHDPGWASTYPAEWQGKTESGTTGSDGTVMVSSKMPPAYGQFYEQGYPAFITHKVDVLDVYITYATSFYQGSLGHSNFYLSD